MTRAARTYFFLLALSVCVVHPTAGQATAPFGALVLSEGHPPDRPEALIRDVRDKLTSLRHAVIPTGSDEHYIAYYEGKPVEAGFPYRWLVHRWSDSMGTMQSVSFRENEEGFLATSFDLHTDDSQTAVMPLELRLLPESSVLLYRWTADSDSPAGGVATATDRPVMVGKPLPDFTAERVEGGTVSPASFRGQHLVINTWAIHCSPCIAEMPGLNQLVETYRGQNIVFLALGYDSSADIKDFMQTHDFDYEQALFNEQISALFGEAFPRNVIVNTEGVVVYDRTGANADQYKQIDQVIREEILNQH